jgi:hypothetical protein
VVEEYKGVQRQLTGVDSRVVAARTRWKEGAFYSCAP